MYCISVILLYKVGELGIKYMWEKWLAFLTEFLYGK